MPQIGVQDDPTFVTGSNDLARAFSAAAGIHASWLRITVRVNRPIGPRTFAAEQAHAHGMSVTATLSGDPSDMPSGPAAYGSWCAQAAAAVPAEAYSTWNEPDRSDWFPGTVADYKALYMACYAGIKSVRPNAMVWLGETSPHAMSFLQALDAIGLPPADGYAHHPYQFSDPALDPGGDIGVAGLARLRPLIGGLPLYLTEFGYKQGSPRAAWICPAITAARRAFANLLVMYQLFPRRTDRWDTSLLNGDGSPTDEYTALQGCV